MSKNKRKKQKRNNYDNTQYYKTKLKKEFKLYRNITRRSKIEVVIFNILYISLFVIGVALLFYNPPVGIEISVFVVFPFFLFLIKYYNFPVTDKFNFNSELGLCECYRRDRTKEILLYYDKLPEFSYNENIFQKLCYRHQKFGKLFVFSFGSKKRKFDRKYEIIKYCEGKNVNLSELIKTQLPRPILIDLEDKVSKIDINKANVAQLVKLPFIDNETAAKIVMKVNNEGDFTDMWDFAEFIKLEQEDIEKLLKLVYIVPPKETIPDFIQQIQSTKNPKQDNSLDI